MKQLIPRDTLDRRTRDFLAKRAEFLRKRAELKRRIAELQAELKTVEKEQRSADHKFLRGLSTDELWQNYERLADIRREYQCPLSSPAADRERRERYEQLDELMFVIMRVRSRREDRARDKRKREKNAAEARFTKTLDLK